MSKFTAVCNDLKSRNVKFSTYLRSEYQFGHVVLIFVENEDGSSHTEWKFKFNFCSDNLVYQHRSDKYRSVEPMSEQDREKFFDVAKERIKKLETRLEKEYDNNNEEDVIDTIKKRINDFSWII